MDNIYKHNWKSFLQNRLSVVLLTAAFILAFVSLYFKKQFLAYNEERSGAVLNDAVLNLIPPSDVNSIIFLFTNIGVLIGLILCFFQPWRNMHLCLCVSILVMFRIATMYLFPLEPPHGIIPIEDIFLKQFFYCEKSLLKDLFFSGHTASLFLLFLLNKDRKYSFVLLISSILVGVLLLVQHVHYTIDVLAAFPFAYCTYFLAKKITQALYNFSVKESSLA